MVKCGQQCSECPYIKVGNKIKFDKSTWKINRRFNCSNYNLIYIIGCIIDKCRQRYIGKSKRPLRNGFADHWGYVDNKNTDTAIWGHFTLSGHNVSNMTVPILEQDKINSIHT